MSGNMSFVNNSEGLTGESVRELAGNNGNRNGERAAPNVSSFLHRSRARDSTTSEANMSSASFQEEAGGHLEPEIILDKDVWATRIILSALENIVFAETPFPKISPGMLQAIQKFILSVNSAVSNVNSFVEFAESVSDSLEHSECEKMSNTYTVISKEVMEALDKGSPENKVVIRSLVMGYIRNTVAALIEQMKTILGLNLASAEPSANKKKTESSPAAGLLKMKADFASIVDAIKSLKYQSVELDDEIRELVKQRDEELKKLNRDVKQLKDIMVDILKVKSAEQEPEFVKQYLDYLKSGDEYSREQLRLENLQIEAEENPEDLRKETAEVYGQLKNQYNNMLTETTNKEHKLQEYKQLGNEYLKILEKYDAVEEEIKTKEWVKEQLQNAPKDDSLFSDSFYD